MKTGFTLIELLIALLLLDVGVLALVGLAASISRNGDDSRLEAYALSVGTARLERTASNACRGATGGTVSLNPGMTERFAELPLPNDTRVIIDSVSYKTTRGAKTIVLQTGARC